jgi:hypothetical protein
MPEAGFSSLTDFTGLPVGDGNSVPPPVLAPGFLSLLDFTGLPIGAGSFIPSAPPVAGFLGLLDFTGLPTGAGIGSPVPPVIPHGHGFRGAGRHLTYIMRMAQQMRQQKQKRQLVERVLEQVTYTKRVLEEGWRAEQQYRKNLAVVQTYSILLAEV